MFVYSRRMNDLKRMPFLWREIINHYLRLWKVSDETVINF